MLKLKTILLGAFAVAGLVTANACSSGGGGATQSEPSTTQAENNGSSTASDSQGESTETGTSPNKPFKVAILLNGSISDDGYNATGKMAADEMGKQLGAEVAVTENVSIPNQADLYRQYAQQGYNLVIGWGGQFDDGAKTVAEEFPDVSFFVLNSQVENGKNLGSIDTDVEQWEFVAGYAMAKQSKSGVIGWIGGQCFPATAANLHGVEQGAKYANPDVKVLSTFTGDFEDPSKGQQAAEAMIGQGADMLTGVMNNAWFGMLKAAQDSDNGTLAVTEWIDNSHLAPDVIMSSILKHEDPFVVDVAKKVQDGTFEGKHYQFGLPEDWGPVLSKTALFPDALYNDAMDISAKLARGEIPATHDTTC